MEIIIDTRWLLLIVLIFLSAFFSASETALMSINIIKAKQLVRKKKHGAGALLKVKENTHRLLSAILIGNNLVNIGASALVTAIAIERFGSAGIGIATGVMTFLILVFGEITPKSFAIRNSVEISLAVAGIFDALAYALSPLIWVLDHINNAMMHLLGSSAKREQMLTEEEITSIVSIGAEEGAIKEQEREMIYRIFKFDDIPVSDVMVPRPEIKMLDADTLLSRMLWGKHIETVKEFSRFPVYEESEDNIIGIFYFKTAMNYLGKKSDKRVRDFVMPALFVPETMKIDTLFFEFQKRKSHMALVVNEHGLVEGLVTLEDILEEIVGEIQDETDVPSAKISEVGANEYVMPGDTHIDEVVEELGIGISDEEADTIGGYITNRLERIPKKGDEVRQNGVKIKVESATKRRVKSVKITVKRKK